MNEKELVEGKFRAMNFTYDRDAAYYNTAHAVFINCLIHNQFDPSRCAKLLLSKNKSKFKVLCEALKDFPEFNKKVRMDLEKYLVLI